MEDKETKFWKLFKQESFYQYFNTRGELPVLLDALTESDIDELLKINTHFIRSYSPSSHVHSFDVLKGKLTLINFDSNYHMRLFPDEVVAILLHEIGHVFNPKVIGIKGEYIADNFAKSKGYTKWIVSGLNKGLTNNWIGFKQAEIELRIINLMKN
jgi:hypothetical protein